jgi:hypothetical protein
MGVTAVLPQPAYVGLGHDAPVCGEYQCGEHPMLFPCLDFRYIFKGLDFRYIRASLRVSNIFFPQIWCFPTPKRILGGINEVISKSF